MQSQNLNPELPDSQMLCVEPPMWCEFWFSLSWGHLGFYTQLYSEKKSHSLERRDFRHQQTDRGEREENLHPDPEITEWEGPAPWDAGQALQRWL